MLPEGRNLHGNFIVVFKHGHPVPVQDRKITTELFLVTGEDYEVLDEYDISGKRVQEIHRFFTQDPKVNVENMAKVADGYTRWTMYKLGLTADHISEQLEYRFRVCSNCIENGSCVVCGCTAPKRLCTSGPCAGGKYPALMGKDDWEKFKKSKEYVKDRNTTKKRGGAIRHSGQQTSDNSGGAVHTGVQSNLDEGQDPAQNPSTS